MPRAETQDVCSEMGKNINLTFNLKKVYFAFIRQSYLAYKSEFFQETVPLDILNRLDYGLPP